MIRPVADDAQLLDGRYLLLERIGSGGMGSVHRAHDQVLDRVVAIKLLHQRDDATEAAVHQARLRAEARFAGALRHPRIVPVFDYAEERDGERVTPYVVMQHVPGRPLSAVLSEGGPLPPERVSHLLAEIADGLATAHAAGIVHRDLKPSNILLTEAGEPVIVDFGIARSDDVDPLTRTGEIIGTADYLSPEQVRGERATGASDVYALGVIGYQCLTATSPFRRETQIATALAHVTDQAPPLPATVPAGLRTLVHAMLLADPRQRPTAPEIARRAVSPEQPTTTLRPRRASPRLRTPRPVAVACAAAVLLVAGVVVAVVSGDPATPPAAAVLAVPSVRGELIGAARHELRAGGFDVAVRRVDGPASAGRVLAQAPGPGEYAGEDPPRVTLRVASGRVPVPADALLGQPFDAAAARLDELGLRAARTEQASVDAAPGQVIAVSAVGAVPVGSTLTLTVATAPPAPVRATAPARRPKTGEPHHPKPAKGPGKGHGKGHGPPHRR